jgi:hypothetical protein
MAEKKSFLLRIDPALWAELESWAANELRSVNGQVEYVLRQAVAQHRRLPSVDSPVSSRPPADTTGKNASEREEIGERNV